MAILRASKFSLLKLSNYHDINLRHFSAANSKDLFDVLEEKVEEDIGFEQWIASTKEAFKNTKGRLWLGKSSPFPYNPAFMPKAILSDISKTKIFELFKQNSKINDHRTLAQQFKISIERVKAILRQKELELELASKGKFVDKEFVSKIESNLDCVNILDEGDHLKDQSKKLPFRPTFICVPEGRGFNFQDSKKILLSLGINIKSPSVQDNTTTASYNTTTASYNVVVKTIDHSPFERTRSKFVFVDIKKGRANTETRILVRDIDGILRTATREEKENVCEKTWNRNRPKNIPLQSVIMSRRAQANFSSEFDSRDYSESMNQDYAYHSNDQYPQENYDYGTSYDYSINRNGVNEVPQAFEVEYENHYSRNNINMPGHEINYNSFNSLTPNQNIQTRQAPLVQASFPVVQPAPLVQQTSSATNFSVQYNYGSSSGKSWLSAFGSGGFDNEPPLLEGYTYPNLVIVLLYFLELGINFCHIKDKTLASLNPFRKLDAGTLNDADLTGPLLFCFLFGTSLLLSGKVHFGYIYGVATLGWISIFTILNLMTENGVSFYITASILGYCLLPMVLLSAVAVLLKLRGIIGLILGVTSVSWCTFSSSTYFVAAFGMQNQQILIAYPIFLLYSCFALMTIF